LLSGIQGFGTTGFEPATYCSQSNRATKLRYVPFVSHSITKKTTLNPLAPSCQAPRGRIGWQLLSNSLTCTLLRGSVNLKAESQISIC
jgi:hypothetical protein